MENDYVFRYYNKAIERAKQLANQLKRQSVITSENGYYVVYGRKEYYSTLSSNPAKRNRQNKIIEFIYPD